MEKRLIVAVAASIIIIVAFQFFAKPSPKPQEECVPCVPPAEEQLVKTEKTTPVARKEPLTPPLQERLSVLENDLYRIEFSDAGGAIKQVSLKRFKEAGTEDPFSLVAIADQRDYMGLIDASGYDVGRVRYAPDRRGNEIVYALTAGPFQITKRYVLIDDKYGVGLEVSVENTSDETREISYRLIAGAGVSEKLKRDERFVEIRSKIGDKVIGYKRPKEGRISHPGEVVWTALKSKYFSVILKPFGTTAGEFYSMSDEGYLVNGVDTGPLTIGPGETIENKYLYYVGPSEISLLKGFGHGLEETVNYGIFGGISKALIAVMKFFYGIVHSWGISILLLAVFLNIILLPLTMKSFKSMQKMQELHPEMEKLKAQYKNNPQKLNQEMMQLYKTYKINPLSGCLPMLLQMPIFFALYQALMKSIELRCTKFLWINDLSMPDAVPIPFTLPHIGNHINILPLIMVAAMVIQQKISTKTMGSAVTTEQSEQQKIMLIVMPVMFGFIFYNMPSGLVLYWVTNTVLTIIEQRALLRKS